MLLFETVKNLIFWIVTRVSARDYTVHILGHCISDFIGVFIKMLENTWKYFCMNSPVWSNLCTWSFCVFGVLCHNFWTNWDIDMLSISKWPSELQFCKRYPCSWQKMALNSRKMAIYQLKKISNWWIHKKLCLSVFTNILKKNCTLLFYQIEP